MNPSPVYFLGDRDIFELEKGDPDFRVDFTGRHSWANGVSAAVRGNWYGNYMVSSVPFDEFQDMSGDIYSDLDLTWDVNDSLSVSSGGNNIFDAAPDAAPGFVICCGFLVDIASVMDWQGPYYYVRGGLRWH